MPPLSLDGTSAARTGLNLPSALTVSSGSPAKRAAMLSFVPDDKWPLMIVGPCHIRIFNVVAAAPPPVWAAGAACVAAGAAGLAVAAPAWVGCAAGVLDGAEQAASKDANRPPASPTLTLPST